MKISNEVSEKCYSFHTLILNTLYIRVRYQQSGYQQSARCGSRQSIRFLLDYLSPKEEEREERRLSNKPEQLHQAADSISCCKKY
jgi:hypothetical protein